MTITTKQYNFIKKVLTMAVPGLVTLIAAFGKIYNFDSLAVTINATITAIATFAGVMLNVVSSNYDKSKEDSEVAK